MGAWPGDQPKATSGIDISSAVLSTKLFTIPIQAVQMALARRSVGVGKMSSLAVRENRLFTAGHGGLIVMWSAPVASVTVLMFSQDLVEIKWLLKVRARRRRS